MSDNTIASLALKVDATEVDKAAPALEKLAAAGGHAEKAAKGVSDAALSMAKGVRSSSSEATQAAKQLDGVSTSADRATKSVRAYTLVHSDAAKSSKALQQATLNLGRQVADIGTQLGSGQSPFMILIQQGPQIADAFKMASTQGLGFKAVMAGMVAEAAPLAAIVLPLAAIAGAIGVIGYAYIKGSKDAADFANALTITGNYAGLTADRYEDMARRVAKATDSSVASTRAGIMQLAVTGEFTGKTIGLMVENAQLYSKFTGQSVSTILAGYEDMKGGVVKWAVQHTESYHDLTLAQIDYIDKLEKQGKHEQAEAQLMQDINDNIRSKAAPAYGFLQQAMHDLGNEASSMWDKILGIGRPKTIGDQLADAQAKVNALKNWNPNGPQNSTDQGTQNALRDGSALRAAQLRLGVLSMLSTGQARAADDAAAKAKAEDDKIRKKYDNQSAKTGQGPQDTSASAIDQATKAELSARMALTQDIEKIAAFKKDEADLEASAAKNRLEQQVKSKSITAAAAATAGALYDRAAVEKKQLIDQQTASALVEREISQRAQMASFTERSASLEASMAASTEERNRIEAASLKAKQDDEAYALAQRSAQQVVSGQITEAYRGALLAAQANAQIDERASATRQAMAAIQAEQNAAAEQVLSGQIDLLGSQADLADTTAARREIELRILPLQQELERLKLQEVIDSATATAAQKEIAAAQLRLLGIIQANQTAAAYRLEDAFGDTADALGGLKRAFESQDWMGAVKSLKSAFDGLKLAFGPNGTLATKIGAAAGVAQGVGAAVGGTGGAVIGGIGSGAAAGATIGSVIPGIGTAVGAAVGAIIGGLGGLFGSSKAKKQAKAEAEAQAAQEAAAKALQIANQRRELEIQILEMSGKSVEALAARRADELAGMDASNRAMQEQVYALQDKAEADAKAAELASTRHDLEIQLMEAQGDAAGALAARRADEIAALDASLQPIQQAINAAKDLADAHDKEAQAAAAAADLAKQRRSLEITLMEAQRNTAGALTAKRADELAALDESLRPLQAAINATNDLAAAREAETQAAQTAAATFADAAGRMDDLSRSLREFADSLTTGDLSGLDPAAKYMTSRNALLTASPDKIADAGRTFLEASKAYQPTAAGYQRDLALVRERALSGADLASRVARDLSLPGFATGGSFLIGGNSGVDQNTLSLNGAPIARVSRGETLGVGTAGGNDNAALIAELRELRGLLRMIADSTDGSQAILKRVTRGGDAMQTEVAA